MSRRIGAAFVAVLLVCPAVSRAQRAGTPAASLGDLSRSLQDLSQRVSASVVQIFVTGYGGAGRAGRAPGQPALQRSSGSGVIVDPDGYIVTNAHVVENATRLEVELPLAATGGNPGQSILGRPGRTLGAQIVAVDQETDIAVIKVDARTLPSLPFGDSDTLRPGQLVLAFGSPLGLDASVTMGIVSAVARQLAPEDPMIYIQTDAPINPGNSGGALVDTDGRLVGLNTLIYTRGGGSEGIGFAAPSNIVRNVFQQIRKTGRVRRGEIGVSTQTITSVLAEALRLPAETGVIVADVAGGPAAAAGLLPGDVILALDGKRMENGRQFRINVYTRGIGEQISLDVQRGERRLTIRVPVVERGGGDTTRLAELLTPENSIRVLGILALDLTPKIAQLLPPRRRAGGVVVAGVAPDAPVSEQGRLQPGDVIHAVNGTLVSSVAELKATTQTLKPGSATVLQIERGGELMFLGFRIDRP